MVCYGMAYLDCALTYWFSYNRESIVLFIYHFFSSEHYISIFHCDFNYFSFFNLSKYLAGEVFASIAGFLK